MLYLRLDDARLCLLLEEIEKVYTRYCKSKILDALSDTPVVVISGPRQSGKTTLAKQLQAPNSTFITLDDLTQLDAAKRDPIGFIRNLDSMSTIIDEAQRVPELFLAIKQSVDENRAPGRFLLTGSSNALMLPTLADSLAGRLEVIELLPLTACEMDHRPSTFLDKIVNGVTPTAQSTRIRKTLIKKVLAGGFPEPMTRKREERRFAWYQQYLNSIIQKDLKDIGQIEHIAVVPKLIRLLANQVGQLINYSDIANKLDITRQTVTKYITLLEQLYIFNRLSAWHKNDNKRLVKTPKIHIVDSGLLCALRSLTEAKLSENYHVFGNILESYVVNEIKRLATWSPEPIELSYYRDKDKVEVDLVLETVNGNLIGIEIKAAATVTGEDFKGLRKFQTLVGKKFLMGMILYDGDHSTQHGDKLYSIPIGCLWE